MYVPNNQLCTYKTKGVHRDVRIQRSFYRDFSKFDEMSTEELNEILRQDSQLPDGEDFDTEQFYILWGDRKAQSGAARHLISEMSITLGVLLTKIIVLLQAKDARSLILMMSHS